MNLYLIRQEINNNYDTYDSAIVCAECRETAQKIHPGYGLEATQKDWNDQYGSWCSSPDQVSVELIGLAEPHVRPNSVILASFNAG